MVIVVRLKDMLERFQARTGERMTYQQLADRSGVTRATIESLATRVGYNASLRTIASLCEVLGCELADMLELRRDDH